MNKTSETKINFIKTQCDSCQTFDECFSIECDKDKEEFCRGCMKRFFSATWTMDECDICGECARCSHIVNKRDDLILIICEDCINMM